MLKVYNQWIVTCDVQECSDDNFTIVVISKLVFDVDLYELNIFSLAAVFAIIVESFQLTIFDDINLDFRLFNHYFSDVVWSI
jgi:hypothetical protein